MNNVDPIYIRFLEESCLDHNIDSINLIISGTQKKHGVL